MAAYEAITEMDLVVACDMNRQRLDRCGYRFSIDRLYEEYETMLSVERPDIVHIVTPPSVRAEPIELAAQYGVRGIIVEKPIALTPPQVQRIRACVERTGIKIAVNMQRRYFESCQRLHRILRDGKIGKITFVRCMTKGNILSMGPHMVDLLLYFLNDSSPGEIWATAYGMNGYEYGHPAPANMLTVFTFPDHVMAYCEDGDDAVGTAGETDFWQQLEINIWGTCGWAWWIQNRDWGCQVEGQSEPCVQVTRWRRDDPSGQTQFTRAMASWLNDDRNIHLNCLANAVRGFDAIMGTFKSVLEHKRVKLPTEIPDDIAATVERSLSWRQRDPVSKNRGAHA